MGAGSNGFNYDFGIAIARGTVRELAILSGATLSVTAAIYGLMTTANDYDETLKNSRVAFGGYTNAIRAMTYAQQKLLDGKSYFDTGDIIQGMNDLQELGINAKKNFDWINNMASWAGKTFTETGDRIVAAIHGDETALRSFGIPEIVMKQFKKFQGNTVMMRDAVIGFLRGQKQFRDGFDKTMVTIPMYFRRMRGFVTLFSQSILGKPTDPNSLLNSFKDTLDKINEFFKAHQKTIVRTGAYIGQILKFMFKTMGEFIRFIFRGTGDAVKALDKFMQNYQHNMMSTLLWLELAKGKVVALFNEYNWAIKTVLVIYALWKATQLGIAATSWVFDVLTGGWKKVAYAIKFARVMVPKFVSDMGKMATAVADYAVDSWYLLKAFYRRWAAQMTYLRIGNTAAMNSFTLKLHNAGRYMRIFISELRAMGSRVYWTTLKADAVSSLTAIWGSIVAASGAAKLYVLDLWAMATAAVTGFVPSFMAATASAWAFAAALLANPITWVVVGVVALVAVVYLLIRHFYGAKTAMATMIDGLILVVGAFFPLVGVILLVIRYWSKFKVIFTNVWHTVLNVAKLAWIKLKDYASQFINWITTKFSFLSTIFDPIVAAFKSVSKWVKDLGNGPLGWLLDKVINLTKNMADSTGAALAAEQQKHGMEVTAKYGEREELEKKQKAASPTGEKPREEKSTASLMARARNLKEMAFERNIAPESMPTPGATTINIYPQQGQSAEQIAQEVMRRIKQEQRTTAQRQGINSAP